MKFIFQPDNLQFTIKRTYVVYYIISTKKFRAQSFQSRLFIFRFDQE